MEDELERTKKWWAIDHAVLRDPNHAHSCPFCKRKGVRGKWELYSQKHSAASLDLWCEDCGERYHAAVLLNDLPFEVADCYPPRSTDGQSKGEESETIVEKIFRVGRERTWW